MASTKGTPQTRDASAATRTKAGRRSNGEGTVYRDGTGWAAQTYVDGVRRKVRARTRTDTLAKLANLKHAAAQDGTHDVERDTRTVGDVLDLWERRTLAN